MKTLPIVNFGDALAPGVYVKLLACMDDGAGDAWMLFGPIKTLHMVYGYLRDTADNEDFGEVTKDGSLYLFGHDFLFSDLLIYTVEDK